MKSVLLTLVFCAGGCIAHAQDVAVEQTARAVRGDILLGNDITQWETLPHYDLSLPSSDGTTQTSAGFFTLGWTSKALLVLGVFEQLPTSSARSEWWLEESLELFIRVQPDSEPVHLSVSPDGEALTEVVIEALESASRFSEKRWILELAISLDALGLPSIETSDVWHFKIARGVLGDFAFWPAGERFSEAEFGEVEFVEAY